VSLITFSLDDAAITAHRLTTRVIREHCQHDNTLTAAATRAIALLDTAKAATDPAWQHAPVVKDLIAQITALHGHLTAASLPASTTKELLELRGWTIHSLNGLGDNPAQAISLGQTLTQDSERILGPDHPDTLTSRNNLAYAYREAGRLDEATALHERTLADSERILGPDHPSTLLSRNNLADAYREAGRLDEATALHERTLADSERIQGPDHPDTRASRDAVTALRRVPE
jgi:tetratricopeptide (TPR) repeat protein